jgi:hypothetical protein
LASCLNPGLACRGVASVRPRAKGVAASFPFRLPCPPWQCLQSLTPLCWHFISPRTLLGYPPPETKAVFRGQRRWNQAVAVFLGVFLQTCVTDVPCVGACVPRPSRQRLKPAAPIRRHLISPRALLDYPSPETKAVFGCEKRWNKAVAVCLAVLSEMTVCGVPHSRAWIPKPSRECLKTLTPFR